MQLRSWVGQPSCTAASELDAPEPPLALLWADAMYLQPGLHLRSSDGHALVLDAARARKGEAGGRDGHSNVHGQSDPGSDLTTVLPRAKPRGFEASRCPASSAGTTPSTTTTASRCSLRTMSSWATSSASRPPGNVPSTRPTSERLSASSLAVRSSRARPSASCSTRSTPRRPLVTSSSLPTTTRYRRSGRLQCAHSGVIDHRFRPKPIADSS